MKKFLDFLSEIDFFSTVFIGGIAIYLSFFIITSLQNYRIDSVNESYYTNNYTITDNTITFVDVWGRNVIIYNDFAVVTLKRLEDKNGSD